MKTINRKLFLLLITLLLALAAPAVASADEGGDRPAASDFDLTSLDGEDISLGDFEGEVVVISFWATWCQPCMQELPHVNAMFEELEGDGLVALAIATDGPDTVSGVRSVAEQEGWSMPVLLDQDGSVSAVLNPRGTNPFTLFIDRQGRIAHEHEGYTSGDEVRYREIVDELLAEEAP